MLKAITTTVLLLALSGCVNLPEPIASSQPQGAHASVMCDMTATKIKPKNCVPPQSSMTKEDALAMEQRGQQVQVDLLKR